MWAGAIFLTWCAASLAWSPNAVAGADELWHFLLLGLIAGSGPANLMRIYWAAGAGMAVNSAVVALQMAGLDPVSHLAGATDTGLFFNKAAQDNFAAMVAVGLLSGLSEKGSVPFSRQLCLLTLAAWVALPLAVGISRAPLVGLGAAAVVWLAHRNKIIAGCALLAVAVAAVVLLGLSDRVLSNLQRVDTWAATARALTPLGHGLGGFLWAFPEMEYAHNDLLQVAYETGFLGLCTLCAFAVVVWRAAGLSERLVLTVFAVEGLFVFPLYWPATSFLAALCAGAALRRRAELRGRVDARQSAGGTGQGVARPA